MLSYVQNTKKERPIERWFLSFLNK